jgi:protein-L-isoaspartate O-methyltransferase
LLRYLKVGGRMVLPLAVHDDDGRGVQRLTVIEKAPTGIREHSYDAVRFVPLLPGLA